MNHALKQYVGISVKMTSTKRLTVAQQKTVLDKLVVKQKNRCAVCGKPFTARDYAVLDHDHETGFIRGALHNSCNGAEGRVKTKANLGHKGVSAAAFIIGLGKYLELHSTPQYNLLHSTHLTADEKRLKRNARARALRKKKKGS